MSNEEIWLVVETGGYPWASFETEEDAANYRDIQNLKHNLRLGLDVVPFYNKTDAKELIDEQRGNIGQVLS